MSGNIPAAMVLDLMRPGDRRSVVQVFDGMSARSRRHRFLAPMPRLSERMLSVLSDDAGRRQVAVGAWLGGRCIGIARAIRPLAGPYSSGVAELAVEVVDRHQGRGLGRQLVERLSAEARRAGIWELEGVIDPRNRAALHLLRGVGGRFSYDEGLVRVHWTLWDQPAPTAG
jgi:L-amino acid N-acyltransferase YncA